MMSGKGAPERKLRGQLAALTRSLEEFEASMDPPEQSRAEESRAGFCGRGNARPKKTGPGTPWLADTPPAEKPRRSVSFLYDLGQSLRQNLRQNLTQKLDSWFRPGGKRRSLPPAMAMSMSSVENSSPGTAALTTMFHESTLEPETTPALPEDLIEKTLGKTLEKTLAGRYFSFKLLARGTMSLVYQGLDRKADRPVAIKFVTPAMAEVARQSLEATRSLDHPNILRVEEVGEAGNGIVFLVMPFLHGSTLRDLLFARRQAVEALLLAFRRVCEGVAHAHDRGVIHRDLKPANIQVGPGGQTTVMDWGLACRAGDPPRLRKWNGKQSQKQSQHILGTPLYMSPEQITRKTLTPGTDVFALGTMLYEILTGRPPAGPGDDVSTVLYRVESQTPPPPSALCGDLQGSAVDRSSVDRCYWEAYDEIVLRCLRKNPGDRFRDAGELLNELEDLTPST